MGSKLVLGGPPREWGAAVEIYIATLDSEATKHEYRRNVSGALAILGGPADITPAALIKYRDQVAHQLGRLSGNTINMHLASLRGFLKFCHLAGFINLSDDAIGRFLRNVKAHVVTPYQVLSKPEIAALLASAQVNPRDHLLLSLALATGLRCAELCNIQVQDLIKDECGDSILRVRQGKGNKDRLVPIAGSIKPELDGYLLRAGLGSAPERYLFESRNHTRRLSTARCRQIITEYLHAAGITKRISMHSLRHTAAITWIRAGASIVFVQKLLGHSKVDTTLRYAEHVEMDDLKGVVNL